MDGAVASEFLPDDPWCIESAAFAWARRYKLFPLIYDPERVAMALWRGTVMLSGADGSTSIVARAVEDGGVVCVHGVDVLSASLIPLIAGRKCVRAGQACL